MEKRITRTKTGNGLIGFGIVIGGLGVILALWGAIAQLGIGPGTWIFLILGFACIVIGYLRRIAAAAESR